MSRSSEEKRLVKSITRIARVLLREGVDRDDAWRFAFAEHGIAITGVEEVQPDTRITAWSA